MTDRTISAEELAFRAVQEAQMEAIADAGWATEEGKRLLTLYKQSVDAVKDTPLGQVYHANSIDPIGFSCYSDCYKDENGFRHRSFITVNQVDAWFAGRADE